ncbi:MAG: hypothetical protein H8D67_17275 [Deltaproteobacteria bacterium]|nr:hypothetical protein [Deltaproteobacteria bacterium]
MKKRFINCFAVMCENHNERHRLILTLNEFKRAKRRFSNDIEKVRREDIRDKRRLTIDNGRCLVS